MAYNETTTTEKITSIGTKQLKILCCAVYFFSYLSRQNYAAVLTEIIRDLNVSKSLAGVAIMGSFISYGLFQIISGIFGDKIKPQKLVFAGLFGSSVVNLLVWFYPNIYFMNVVWCLNGVFQSLIWPPLVRLVVDNLGEKEYSVTVVRITQASYIATVFVYVASPFVITSLNWRWVFAFSGFGAMIFSIIWILKTKNIGKEHLKNESVSVSSDKKINYRQLLVIGFIPIIFSTFVAGFMRDGITTWMPTYINETYGVSSFSSILTGAVIPVCCALFLELLNFVGEKIGNEVKTASLYLALALTSCVALYWTFSTFPAFDVTLMAMITVCVHGVNLMLVCNVPKRFAKYGKTSTMSGILNSAVYAGSALSAYGVAALAVGNGWRNVILIWSGAVLVAFILCMSCIKKYEKEIGTICSE